MIGSGAAGAEASSDAEAPAAEGALPELASVAWRPRVSERRLGRMGWGWTLTSAGPAIPFTLAAGLLIAVRPVLAPVSLVLLAHAWAIPELYANRGAGVVRPRPPSGPAEEGRALLLLGDLLDDGPRELHARTGLALQRGELGTWLVGEAGALLVRPGARRVNCYCVKATGERLPASDRISHLLLALRTDERGFATVANLAFSGARWRVRRRLPERMRPALDAAARLARADARGRLGLRGS